MTSQFKSLERSLSRAASARSFVSWSSVGLLAGRCQGLNMRQAHARCSTRTRRNMQLQASVRDPSDPYNAYIDKSLIVPGVAEGPLRGLSFAVKDLFDVAGHLTGFGNPIWLETHPPATHTAPAVQALLNAGATLRGKTHMDELAYSLNGENVHYGTPINPAAPGRIPGGSSSGSAVAVACGDVDIGLGTDTGGSIRVPASFCGLLGIRPSWGRVSAEGTAALAPSFTTPGWCVGLGQATWRRKRARKAGLPHEGYDGPVMAWCQILCKWPRGPHPLARR
ncbi:hypothetical protein Vafri_14638 [Volvox africanus]|uniref:Amidase domain-containing protein n=2 Tax=Volvox africanus TaxID=51714 RepID=A0A8J4F4N6_9CHLO|nr:hypothetical protein Vafri_14638 [Volvox africanus]